mgnify:CR=1 FL=1
MNKFICTECRFTFEDFWPYVCSYCGTENRIVRLSWFTRLGMICHDYRVLLNILTVTAAGVIALVWALNRVIV